MLSESVFLQKHQTLHWASVHQHRSSAVAGDDRSSWSSVRPEHFQTDVTSLLRPRSTKTFEKKKKIYKKRNSTTRRCRRMSGSFTTILWPMRYTSDPAMAWSGHSDGRHFLNLTVFAAKLQKMQAGTSTSIICGNTGSVGVVQKWSHALLWDCAAPLKRRDPKTELDKTETDAARTQHTMNKRPQPEGIAEGGGLIVNKACERSPDSHPSSNVVFGFGNRVARMHAYPLCGEVNRVLLRSNSADETQCGLSIWCDTQTRPCARKATIRLFTRTRTRRPASRTTVRDSALRSASDVFCAASSIIRHMSNLPYLLQSARNPMKKLMLLKRAMLDEEKSGKIMCRSALLHLH